MGRVAFLLSCISSHAMPCHVIYTTRHVVSVCRLRVDQDDGRLCCVLGQRGDGGAA